MRKTAFRDLYDGKRSVIHVSIQAEATMANRPQSKKRKVRSGIYTMTTDECRRIINAISGEWGNPYNLLYALDTRGARPVWFRWSEPVARWLRSKAPIIEAEAMVSGPAN